ncbi:MAG TPA: hypothetical protein VNS80_08030 [Pseudolysinimonas sp.]|nr:hypothetical protein [Pseudolysinimonas sp.]
MSEFSGSFRVRDALARGVGAGSLRSRHLSAPFQGVRSITPPRDMTALCRAYATKMRPDAAFCGLSAARLWGMPLPIAVDDDIVHVSTPHGGPRPTGRGVHGYQHDADYVEIRSLGALRVFSPIHTWLSLGRLLALPDLVAAADFILTPPFGSGEPALATLMQLRDAVTRNRILGRPNLLRAASLALPGPLSRPESHCRVLLVSAGCPMPVPNLSISPLATLDLAWPTARYGLDYLGDQHRSPTQFAKDVGRRELIREIHWESLEITKNDLYDHPHHVAVKVRSRLSERGVVVRPVHPSKFVLPKR